MTTTSKDIAAGRLRRHWWLIVWAVIVLAALALSEFMPESVTELQ